MAYSFPLPLAQFFNILPIRTQLFELSAALETSETGGGEIITADYGPRLWQGSVSLIDQPHARAQQVNVRIDILREAGASFLVTDYALPGPAYDLTGSILGTRVPALKEISRNRKEVKLGGLPSGYTITPGDLLSFRYARAPVRYALHKAVSIGTMRGRATNWIEVRPHLRPGAAVGTRVLLHAPVCKAVLVPGSLSGGTRARDRTGGIGFRWRQTLR